MLEYNNMDLSEKYRKLIELAQQYNLSVKEDSKVLKISGEVADENAKDEIWKLYNEIDPSFKSEEVEIDIDVTLEMDKKVKVSADLDEINIYQSPSIEQYLVGKARKGEVLKLLRKIDKDWSYIRTKEGLEGYCMSKYLESI